MSTDFLSRVYRANSPVQVRSLYDDWAASYESEISENGYVTPARCAEALLAAGADPKAPVLDFGCGTGLSGLALRLAGFEMIDGRDLSEGMLAKARDKGVYRDLAPIGPEGPVPTGYAAIAAIGVVSPGAAPLPVLDRLIDALAPGMRLVSEVHRAQVVMDAQAEAEPVGAYDPSTRAAKEYAEVADEVWRRIHGEA